MQNNFGKYTRRVSAMSMTLLLLLCGCAGTPTGEPPAETERRHYSTSSDAGRKRETLSPDWLDGVIPDAPSTLPGVSLTLPAVTTEYAPFLAVGALTLCSGHTAEKTAALLSGAGFDIVAQHGYDKSAADPAHTCAWTLASREIIYGGAPRTLFAVVVRGTEDGEWYSNFDFAPSHSDDATFAENFLFAAEDVLAGITEPLTLATQSGKAPIVLVCGHSRGAACANLLGMLLNTTLGRDSVMTYTFATPATFRGEDCGVDCSNIFNHINPADIVTEVPLAAWGYRRLGVDITLTNDAADVSRVADAVEVLRKTAPTISQYYTERHSLTYAGTSEDGLTAFEFVLAAVAAAQKSGNKAGAGTSGANASDTGASGNGASGTGTSGAGTSDAGTSGKGTAVAYMLDTVSPDSDFAPLVELLRDAMSDNGALAAETLRQHLPMTYLELLSAKKD